MSTVSLPFPRCRICHGDIWMLPRRGEPICGICARADDVQGWHEKLRAARAKLAATEREVACCCGEHGGRRARRHAETKHKKARSHERRATFRLVSAQLTAGLRGPDETLSGLEEARRGFDKLDREPRRRFAAYARSRFEGDALTLEAFQEIERSLTPMTGCSAFPVDPPDIFVDLLLGLANGNVWLEFDPPPPLTLPPSEPLQVWAVAELGEPAHMVQSQTTKGEFTAPLGLGARVGIERAHTVTSERPGTFHNTANGIVAVTSLRVVFIGDSTVSIDHRDIVGIRADSETCEIHDRTVPLPLRFRTLSGWAPVVAAYVNAGHRRLN